MSSSTNRPESHERRNDVEGGPDQTPVTTQWPIVSSVMDILAEITAILFSIRTRSPWLTLKEAERYTRSRHGELRDALSSGELKSFRRTPQSPALINARHIDEWIVSTWFTVQREREEAGEA